MKKQILTLTLCLALTATSALAAGTNSVAHKAVAKTKITTTIKTPTKATTAQNIAKPGEQPKFMTQEEAKKHFEERRAAEREHIYKDLGLSVDQKTKAEAIDAKTREGGRSAIRKVQVEHKKLRDLKTKHASAFAIWKQKRVLKSAKKDADKFFGASRKQFEAILTDTQKAKLKVIDAERKARMENAMKRHHHDFSKMGPKPEGPQLMGPPLGEGGHEGPHGPAPVGPPPANKK